MLPKTLCPLRQGKPEMLLDYVAQRLPAGASETLEAHAAECDDCQKVLAAQAEVWSAMDGMAAPAVSADFDARLYARIAEQNQESIWKRAWRKLFESGEPVSWRPAAALSVACAAVLAIVLMQPATRRVEVPKSGPVIQEQAVTARETWDVELVERTLDDLEMVETLARAEPVL